MEDIRILLLCSNRFALQTMQELAFFGQLAAIAIPAQCDEWLEHAQAAMAGSGVPILIIHKETYVAQLKEACIAYKINIGLICTFSFKIPKEVYTLPENGFFNIHPSSLPAYRGADPVFHMIRNREKLAGVTIHAVSDTFDAGAIVIREQLRITANDTYGLLSQKLSIVASRLANNLIKLISFDLPLPLKIQDESKATYYKKQTAADVSINWDRMTADEIVALINACNPWNKGASTRINNRIMRLLGATVHQDTVSGAILPGTIVSADGHKLVIACSNSTPISVGILATDEGIFTAGRLLETGIHIGNKFESIV